MFKHERFFFIRFFHLTYLINEHKSFMMFCTARARAGIAFGSPSPLYLADNLYVVSIQVANESNTGFA